MRIFPRKVRDNQREESGFLAAEWLIGISLLLIPTFIIVFSLVQLPARKNLTQVASAAAARAYVQALDQSQAEAAARAAAAEAISQSGKSVTPSDVDMKITQDGGYCPGEEITISVSLPFPVTINPFSGSSFSSGAEMSSSSTERIDDYAELVNSDTFTDDATFPFDVDEDAIPGCPE